MDFEIEDVRPIEPRKGVYSLYLALPATPGGEGSRCTIPRKIVDPAMVAALDERASAVVTLGSGIRLTGEMPGEAKFDPLPVGAEGVVMREANAAGQIWVKWQPPHENRSLMLLDTDPFEVVAVPPAP